MMRYSQLLIASLALTSTADAQVMLNQTGFAPTQEKHVFVISNNDRKLEAMPYSVKNENGEQVLKGQLKATGYWPAADQNYLKADLSSLTKLGSYQLSLANGKSIAFNIDNETTKELLTASLKSYYFMRASTALDEKHAGPYARPLGHPDDKVIIHKSAASELRPEGSIVSSPGGWYDAGDYNKYVVNSAITLYTLLRSYQDFPTVFEQLDLNIPESHNGLADILDESLWQLDWLLTMQDPNDGGVYHKLTNLGFDGMVAPHEATKARYMIQKSTGAALDFAAVTAYAARILKDIDPKRADKSLAAAKAAWHWAKKHPDKPYIQPNDVHTGAYIYDGEDFVDEWFWAATELAISENEPNWLKQIDINGQQTGIPSWDFVAPLAWISLSADAGSTLQDAKKLAKAKLKQVGDKLLAEFSSSALKTTMGTFLTPFGNSGADFVWGSNAVASNHNLVLWHVRALHNKQLVDQAIQGNVDYLLGKNPTGYCFLSGFGHKSPINIHHRLSEGDNVDGPIPGFLIGGPNPDQQDQVDYPSNKPALSYVDDLDSYASNEIAINWNAPFVYSLAAISQIQSN